MARTKQTARKHFGGKAPRKVCVQRSMPSASAKRKTAAAKAAETKRRRMEEKEEEGKVEERKDDDEEEKKEDEEEEEEEEPQEEVAEEVVKDKWGVVQGRHASSVIVVSHMPTYSDLVKHFRVYSAWNKVRQEKERVNAEWDGNKAWADLLTEKYAGNSFLPPFKDLNTAPWSYNNINSAYKAIAPKQSLLEWKVFVNKPAVKKLRQKRSWYREVENGDKLSYRDEQQLMEQREEAKREKKERSQ